MSKGKNGQGADAPASAGPAAPDVEYRVGPGCPPREHQFKPGQSGNPKGAKRKPRSIMVDLEQLFITALNKTITLKQGERKRIVTMVGAGFEQLAAQLAKGDRYARRDVYCWAKTFGIGLGSGDSSRDEPLTAQYEAMLNAWCKKQYDEDVAGSRVFAPPELLDDDSKDPKSD